MYSSIFHSPHVRECDRSGGHTVLGAILLVAAVVLAQPYVPNGGKNVPVTLQTFYTEPYGANTGIVELGSVMYVGTDQGIIGGYVGEGEVSPQVQNETPLINLTTKYPVTTLWNTSLTEMVAVANDTLHAFTGNISKWNFTSPGFQFGFAATMDGQYPSPLVYNNTIVIGTGNCHWVSGAPGWSWVYAINLATGVPSWSVKVPGAYTNYQIQLGDDQHTIVVRATTPGSSTNIYLLRGATGAMLPFVTATRFTAANFWLPRFVLYAGTLWINDYGGYIDVVNTTTNFSTGLRSFACNSDGLAPMKIGDVVRVAAGSSVYAFDAISFKLLSTNSAGSVGTLQQILPYNATRYFLCGTNGVQSYDLAANSFVNDAAEFDNASPCEGLSQYNGLLVANFGEKVHILQL